MSPPPGPCSDRDLVRYLAMLAGRHPARRFVEIRYGIGAGAMGRRFIPADRPAEALRLIKARAQRADVYCGVGLRDRRAGGRDAVSRLHLAFVEIDHPDAESRFARFAHQPTAVIASGTPGHLHLYFQLTSEIGPLELELANRRLAHALSGDLAAVDAARILRPPASRNHKSTPPTPVRLIAMSLSAHYPLGELTAGLSDPPGRPARGPAAPRRAAAHPLDQQLLQIPAADYVQALAGLEPSRAGKISCPFHDQDDTPSLQLYADNSWYCFGCQRGGSIYDFAAAVWLSSTKGRAFLELRDRLAAELGIPTATSALQPAGRRAAR